MFSGSSGTANPLVLSCQEACAQLFGSAIYYSYSGSISGTSITSTCNGDAHSKFCYQGTNVQADDFKGPSTYYNVSGTFSAYVNDHTCQQVGSLSYVNFGRQARQPY